MNGTILIELLETLAVLIYLETIFSNFNRLSGNIFFRVIILKELNISQDSGLA